MVATGMWCGLPAGAAGSLGGRRFPAVVLTILLASSLGWAQSGTCSCGANPPGPPKSRSAESYANTPDDLKPFSKFTRPYYENYTKTPDSTAPPPT
jgi:hypothetical protein